MDERTKQKVGGRSKEEEVERWGKASDYEWRRNNYNNNSYNNSIIVVIIIITRSSNQTTTNWFIWSFSLTVWII